MYLRRAQIIWRPFHPVASRSTSSATTEPKRHSILNSTRPVYLPPDPALFLNDADFQDYIRNLVRKVHVDTSTDEKTPPPEASVHKAVKSPEENPFMTALFQSTARIVTKSELESKNQTFTDNMDVAFSSSKSVLVDLFCELTDRYPAAKFENLLSKAWDEDSLATLKIIFHTRSIHIGKNDRMSFYQAVAWLAKNHPLTLLHNLPWLTRPVIPKKIKKVPENSESALEKAECETAAEDVGMHAYDVKFGVAHGYWKDLLNILALAVNQKLYLGAEMHTVLNIHLKRGAKTPPEPKSLRDAERKRRHERVLNALETDSFYRALHLTVSRLFASQLQQDMDRLKNRDLRSLSLAGKWFPTCGLFHDKHTFVTSAIAEILFPPSSNSTESRELYLRRAREDCRHFICSPIRKGLAVVERDISAKSFHNIQYNRIPSVAMQRYTQLFIEQDYDHFYAYVQKMSHGKSRISGATLLPSTLVKQIRAASSEFFTAKKKQSSKIAGLVIDGQWRALVQRIKDSGTLQSAIAVCDVSGSMMHSSFRDGSCPLDSAIGLSLLLAEVVQAPFGGAVITFSEHPAVVKVGGPHDKRLLSEKVQHLAESQWDMNTNFTAVFEDLILPMAIQHNLKQEDMVKQVFVFSDMQFDAAQRGEDRWSTSFERIQKKYREHGYEMPELIFWNLGRSSETKPVTVDEVGTALVSGYSQGQMKMFLEKGALEGATIEQPDNQTRHEEQTGEGKKTPKVRIDPLLTVKKAIDHESLQMLEVVD